ncbi:MAG: DinB family protein [Bacteroidota bacterium]
MSPLKLLQYNTWANRLISTTIEPTSNNLFEKSVGGSFGSLKATIVHLLESDYLWLQRFNGIPIADLPSWNTSTASAINKIWNPLQDEMIALAEKITPTQNIHFITRKGIPFNLPFEEIVTHLSHHGSYHRGQLTNIIRELGLKPVATDYFIFATK